MAPRSERPQAIIIQYEHAVDLHRALKEVEAAIGRATIGFNAPGQPLPAWAHDLMIATKHLADIAGRLFPDYDRRRAGTPPSTAQRRRH